MNHLMGEHRIVEHTADVGVAATAATLEDLFREVTLGLLDITGARANGSTETDVVGIELSGGRDVAGLLVEWLGEVLYLQDAGDRVIGDVHVEAVTDSAVKGRVSTAPRVGVLEGTPVKAVTYHQLVVEEHEGVFNAQVFFDI